MEYLAISLYAAALIFQIVASVLALGGFQHAGKYRFGWLLFSLTLMLMIGRNDGHKYFNRCNDHGD